MSVCVFCHFISTSSMTERHDVYLTSVCSMHASFSVYKKENYLNSMVVLRNNPVINVACHITFKA